jgi:hypothetical protein
MSDEPKGKLAALAEMIKNLASTRFGVVITGVVGICYIVSVFLTSNVTDPKALWIPGGGILAVTIITLGHIVSRTLSGNGKNNDTTTV